MSGIKDLLGDQPYPHSPGYKEPTTSKAASQQMKARAPALRYIVLGAIRSAGANGLTADEAATALGKTVLAVRPRVTELLAAKAIRDSGHTRPNASGVKATVWVVA